MTMQSQKAEFDAVADLAEQYRRITCTPIVDDDYPEVRHHYESAMHRALRAIIANGRLFDPPVFAQLSENDAALFREQLKQPGRLEFIPGALTFDALRRANMQRLPRFKNRKGEPAHSKADGSDWSLNDWYTAAAGEMGELGSKLKQIRRGDISLGDDVTLIEVAKEIADVIIYLDILAYQLRLSTGAIVRAKFNEVSERVGCPDIAI